MKNILKSLAVGVASGIWSIPFTTGCYLYFYQPFSSERTTIFVGMIIITLQIIQNLWIPLLLQVVLYYNSKVIYRVIIFILGISIYYNLLLDWNVIASGISMGVIYISWPYFIYRSFIAREYEPPSRGKGQCCITRH